MFTMTHIGNFLTMSASVGLFLGIMSPSIVGGLAWDFEPNCSRLGILHLKYFEVFRILSQNSKIVSHDSSVT